jgi:hypothetical protein
MKEKKILRSHNETGHTSTLVALPTIAEMRRTVWLRRRKEYKAIEKKDN